MTIVIEGDLWHIETFLITFTQAATAGRSTSTTTNLTRPGTFIMGTITGVDNGAGTGPQLSGMTELFSQATASVVIGEKITGVQVSLLHAASSGAQTVEYIVSVMIRD